MEVNLPPDSPLRGFFSSVRSYFPALDVEAVVSIEEEVRSERSQLMMHDLKAHLDASPDFVEELTSWHHEFCLLYTSPSPRDS